MSEIVKSSKKPSTVTTINDIADVRKFIKDIQTGSCVILYRMNGCGHCDAFMPTWEKIKDRFNTQKKIYEVEFSKMEEIFPRQLKISAFPSIVSYNSENKPNTVVQFSGFSRTFDNVSDFINKYVKTVKTPRAPSKLVKTPTSVTSSPKATTPKTKPTTPKTKPTTPKTKPTTPKTKATPRRKTN